MRDDEPGPTRHPAQVWTSEPWLHEVTAWIDEVLTSRGVCRIGPPEQVRVRPWATQLTVLTSIPGEGGTFWFKDNAPPQRFEAGVVEVIARRAPGRVVPPVALDAERGWLLTAHAGPTLAALVGSDGPGGGDLSAWQRVVAEYAALQQQLTPHVTELAAAGLPEVEPGSLPTVVADAVESLVGLSAHDPAHLDSQRAHDVERLLPEVARWAQVLADSAIALTLDHNDLHTNNVISQCRTGAPGQLIDFADGLLGHPWCSMLIPLNVLAHELAAGAQDVRLRAVRDAYLEVWGLDPAARMEVMDAALRAGRVSCVLAWMRLLPVVGPAERPEYGGMPAAWLRVLGADPPVRCLPQPR